MPNAEQYRRLRDNHICPSCWVRQAPEGYVQCERCRVYKQQHHRQKVRQAEREKEAKRA